VTHSAGDHTLAYVWSAVQEGGTDAGNNKTDFSAHIFWGNFKGIGGGALSLYYILADINDNVLNAGSTFSDNDFHTVGFRQAGTLAGFDYRGEFYYQFGAADGAAAQQTIKAGSWDRSAFMIGARIGKKFGPLSATLWYDYLSGTDEKDIDSNKVGSFDTVFDTGHKFYGLMDRFLTIGTTSRTAGGSVQSDNVKGLGLQDYALKLGYTVNSQWTAKVDAHSFYTAEDSYTAADTVGATGAVATTLANGKSNDNKNHLGEEVDLTVIHKYSASTNIVFGYSHFFAASLGNELLGNLSATSTVNDDADWAYIMMDVKF